MSDLVEIKERIYNENLVEALLLELDCQYVKEEQHGELYVAQLPTSFGSDNRRSVQVKNNPSLTSYIRSKGISGDVFSLVGYLIYECTSFEEVKEHLHQIKAWICNVFEWSEYLSRNRDDFQKKSKKRDWLAHLRPIQKRRKAKSKLDELEFKTNKVKGEGVLNRYIPYPHYSFIKDGIGIKTQREFNVGFDIESERVIFPVHNQNGELIGVKGRYVGKDKSTLKEKKYIYLVRMDKSIELFNLHRAMPYILEKGEVIVFEGAKSCMLAWDFGVKNTVSIEGSELSPVQASLLKQLGVNIVFAFDKGIDEEHVRKQARQVKSRLCYYIEDHADNLEHKDSPVDKGLEVWMTLYHNYKYTVVSR